MDKKNFNKISVLLPIYSGDKLEYLKLAINSILNQSYKDFQLILCIDGPIKKKIENYIHSLDDTRIKLCISKINIGLPAILNKAIKKYKSDFYFRMDADDISEEIRIEKILNFFNNDKDLMLVGSECIVINEMGKEIFYKKLPSEYNDIIKCAYTRSPIIHGTVCFKKEFFDIVGYYNVNFKQGQDYELWSRALLKKIKMTSIHEPLIKIRIFSDVFKRRAKWKNIKNETKVSLLLINSNRAYHHLPKLTMKVLFRIISNYMPDFINHAVNKYFR